MFSDPSPLIPQTGLCISTSLFSSTNDLQQLTYINNANGIANGFATFGVIAIPPPETSGTTSYPESFYVTINTNFAIRSTLDGAFVPGTVKKLMDLAVTVGPPPAEGERIVYDNVIILQQNSGKNIAEATRITLTLFTSNSIIFAQLTTYFN